MKATAVVALVMLGMVAGAHALSTDVDAMWEEFKVKYNKGYAAEEHDMRREIFGRNWALAHERNAANIAAGGGEVHGMGPFLDIEPEEFLRTHTMPNFGDLEVPKLPVYEPPQPTVRGALATSLDWRDKGVVTPVKDQGQCGSCWAFSATETIESANAMAGKSLDTLAPQQIVDCDNNDNACGGGMPSSGISYVQNAGGQEGESSYPYTSGTTGSAGSCNFNKGEIEETTTGYQSVGGGEGGMVSTMQSKGPLSIVVDASSWQTYSGGVMQNCGTSLDHAVQAVGYNGVSLDMVKATWVSAAEARRLQFDDANDPGGNDVPANDVPANDVPANDANDVPANDTPANDTPANDTPANDTPANDTPANDTPANDTPHNDTPHNDSPHNDSPSPSGGYWIVRNSWNTSWGENGYIYLAYGGNTCGLTSMVVYATA